MSNATYAKDTCLCARLAHSAGVRPALAGVLRGVAAADPGAAVVDAREPGRPHHDRGQSPSRSGV